MGSNGKRSPRAQAALRRFKRKHEGVCRKALAFTLALVLALGNMLGMFGQGVPRAYAGDGTTIHFDNGGSAILHGDGSITGTCTLSDCTVIPEGAGYRYLGSNCTMPDGAVLWVECYESYIGVPDHDSYDGPVDGTCEFTATPNDDGTYFVLVHSQDLPGCFGRGKTQRVYNETWSATVEVTVNFTKVSADASFTDGNSEYAYVGAEYDIYDASNDSKVDTITTDEGGHASLKLKPNKRYYAVETKAPKGFTLNSERIYFTTGNNTSAERLADDPGEVYFTIKKKDAATLGGAQPGATLEGAEYKIVDANGDTHTATSDADGFVYFYGIPFGKFTVTETKPPAGYKLDPTPHEYYVSAEEHSVEITDSGVVELAPEDDFKENVVAFDIEIAKFTDDDTSEESGIEKPAAGVRFQIISNTTEEVVGTIETNDNGFASTEGLWFGEGERTEGINGALPYDKAGYTIHEVEETVPEGFAHVGDWKITADSIADGVRFQYIIDDHVVTTRLQIVKVDAETGQTVPMPGFTFQLLDEDKQPVSQEVWYPNHSELNEFTTDETGAVTLPEALRPGTYYIHETAAGSPYLLGEDIEFTIEYDVEGLEPLTVVKYADRQAMGYATLHKVCAEEDCPLETVAEPRTDDAEAAKGLAGAEFDVIALEDVISPDGTVRAVANEVVDHVTTDDSGYAETCALYLGSGTARYAFVETKAPAGHVLNPEPIEFTLAYANDYADLHLDVEVANEPTELHVDKTILGTDEALGGAEFALWNGADEIALDVQDGATALAVRTGDDSSSVEAERQLEYATVDAAVPDGYTAALTGEDGRETTLSDTALFFAPGTYTLSLSDEDGVVEFSGETEFNLEAGSAYTLTVTDSILTGLNAAMGAGGAVEDRVQLPYDAENDVYAASGIAPGGYDLYVDGEAVGTLEVEAGSIRYCEVADGEAGIVPMLLSGGKQPDRYTSDDEGDITVKHLVDGSYRIKEVKAPDGFLVDGETHYFTVTEDGMIEGMESFTIPVEDDYTKIELTKRDISDEAEVEGAKLTILDSDGEVVDSWISTTEPHRINALAPGDYTLVEEMTPHTYDEATAVEFTVLETGEVQRVVMYDEPIEITGEIDKRQEIADPTRPYTEANGDGLNTAETSASEDGSYDYSIDFRSTSSTWVDEFTVEDSLQAATDGLAELTGITTPQAWQDYDGKMNVWFTTNLTPSDYADESGANATLSDGHDNPWLSDESTAKKLGDDGRVIDFTGWKLWSADVSTTEAVELSVADLGLAEGEFVTGIRFEFGRVEEGFTSRQGDWDRDDLKDIHDDLDDVQATHEGEGFAVPATNIVEIKGEDGAVLEARYMTDDELAACEDGAGYMVDCGGAPTFVPIDNVHRVDAREVAFAPAIVHMRVADEYAPGTELLNAAKVDLYRNGGALNEDEPLEDHDDDTVRQTPKEQLPEIGTTLTDAEDGDHLVEPGKVELVDTIAYSGAEPGVEHVMRGTLMDKATSKPVLGEDGEPVTNEVFFVPEKSDGELEVSFEFDTSGLDGHDVVAFEVMSCIEAEKVVDEETGEVTEEAVERVVASHEDINDGGQTVRIASEPTGTLDQTGGNTLAIAGVCILAAGAAAGAYILRRRRLDAAGREDGTVHEDEADKPADK